MIRATELRIGNKFIGIAGIQTVLDISDNTDRGTIEYVSDQHRLMYSHLIQVQENRNQYKPCEIEGVILTEEILLKCKGFTGSGERFEFDTPDDRVYPFAIIYRHTVWNIYDTAEDYCLASCSYLHELQNIYYWVFNKIELEITL